MGSQFKVGDKVKINYKATLEDLVKKAWNGCGKDTINFLNYEAREYDSKIYKVTRITEMGNCFLDDNDKRIVNKNILELVERPILNDEEKEYLGKLIKPFRNEVERVVKYQHYVIGKQYIYIACKNFSDCFSLPSFEVGTMYKGMVEAKDYTLEELGL